MACSFRASLRSLVERAREAVHGGVGELENRNGPKPVRVRFRAGGRVAETGL